MRCARSRCRGREVCDEHASEAVQEYLNLRRSLGFKLREAGKQLLEFVTFMEQRRASYITTQLALAWAQQPRPCSRPSGRGA